jgi:hypothetical protein
MIRGDEITKVFKAYAGSNGGEPLEHWGTSVNDHSDLFDNLSRQSTQPSKLKGVLTINRFLLSSTVLGSVESVSTEILLR